MKLRIEMSDEISEDEVIIRCGRMDETVRKIQAYILSLSEPKIVFYKGQQEFYFPLNKILFFETEDEQVYAHTESDSFKVKFRLYELETLLPNDFVRVAKGTIVNTQHIYSISQNLASASLIKFAGTHKQVYVSRHYYKILKNKMECMK